MKAALLTERESGVFTRNTPHLSHSRVNKYLLCPEQYRLYYVEGLRPILPSAALVFGQVVHAALAHLLEKQDDPVNFFTEVWAASKKVQLTYRQKDSWEKHHTSGKALLKKFVADELPKLTAIEAVERPFTLDITSLDLPFVGVIDLVATFDGKRTVVDFKTSAKVYEDHEAPLSDQLSAYSLAEPSARQAALCVLVKTKEPKIEWHPTTRTDAQLSDYLAKVGLVGREIAAGRFYKRPGNWCGWCDFLPCCVGNTKQVEETLVKVR